MSQRFNFFGAASNLLRIDVCPKFVECVGVDFVINSSVILSTGEEFKCAKSYKKIVTFVSVFGAVKRWCNL
jgi:hypothetical protein